jgi:hypothetical protein
MLLSSKRLSTEFSFFLFLALSSPLPFGCASAQPRFFEDLEEPTTITDGERAPPVEAEAEEDEEEEGKEEDVEKPDVWCEEPDLEGWIEEEEELEVKWEEPDFGGWMEEEEDDDEEEEEL